LWLIFRSAKQKVTKKPGFQMRGISYSPVPHPVTFRDFLLAGIRSGQTRFKETREVSGTNKEIALYCAGEKGR
jgi:hypothetical protein